MTEVEPLFSERTNMHMLICMRIIMSIMDTVANVVLMRKTPFVSFCAS